MSNIDRNDDLVPQFIKEIKTDGPALAVFDADGVLWRKDVADDFAMWMMNQGHLHKELWPRYEAIYREDAPAGCRFMLELYKGMPEKELAAHVNRYWNEQERDYNDFIIATMHWVKAQGFTTYVVSGTPTNILYPVLDILPVDKILGMDYEVGGDGIFTGKHTGISCAGIGKADKIEAFWKDRVSIVIGNALLDADMLKLAKDAAWAVHPDDDLLKIANENNWHITDKPADFVEEDKFTE